MQPIFGSVKKLYFITPDGTRRSRTSQQFTQV
jgi:hypothetical protein